MNYEYIRQLTEKLSEDEVKKLVPVLLGNGIEVFYLDSSEHVYRNAAQAADIRDGILYISAADLDRSRKLLQENGYDGAICKTCHVQVEESAVEKAEREYYRKRRMTMIECGVILAAVLLYLLIRALIL